MSETTGIIFQEIQHARQVWLFLLVFGIAGLIWVFAFFQLILGRPVGTRPAPNGVLIIIFIAVGILLPAAFLTNTLKTTVKEEGIYFSYFPFIMKERFIPRDEIEGYSAVKYNPLKEYGGFGVRFGAKAKAYNASGDKGVMIEVADRKDILLGSQKAEELEAAIDKIMQ